jgi:aminoglycoside N3'-acetyltransferase
VTVSVAQLTDELRRLGVVSGEMLMVHASMRRVGAIDGGALGVVSAVDAAVGQEGTWMMTLGAIDEWSWVNERPEHERPGLLAGGPVFDASTVPADPDIGVLAEVFRTAPGTFVSDHPEGRFGARGRDAEWLVADVAWDDYYGAGSPLERFVERSGRVLRLGADDDTVTLIHYAEFLAPLARKTRVRRHRLVRGPDGPVVRVVDTLDDSNGIARYSDTGDDDEFAVILREFRATGNVTTGRVGGAEAELFDGRALVDFAVAWIVEHAVADAGG